MGVSKGEDVGVLVKATTVLVLTVVIIVPLVLGLFLRNVPQGFQPSLDRTIDLNSKTSVSQTFAASGNNLSIIGVSIKNPNLLNKEDADFNIYSDGALIRQVALNGKNIPDGDFIKIRFAPIPDSAGKTFKMEFVAPGVTRNPLEIFISNQPKQGETLYINNTPFPGSIAYVPFYKASNPVSESLSIYATLFSQLSKDLEFTAVYGLLIAGGLVFLII